MGLKPAALINMTAKKITRSAGMIRRSHHISENPLLVEYSCYGNGEYHSYGNHDTNGTCIERGNEYKEYEHENDRGNGKLEVLGYEHYRETAEAASGCRLEVTQRDVYLLHGNIDKVRRYVELGRAALEKYWKP